MNNDLIKKYLDGRCTPEEEQEVLQFLREGNEHLLHEHIASLEKTVDGDVPAAVSGALLENINAGIEARQRKGRRIWMRTWQAAAAAVLLAAVSVFLFRSPGSTEKENIQLATLHNGGSEVRKIGMPDGSTIWLNAGATLSYDEQAYNGTVREVTVTGEAYFDVAADPQRPFRVRTGEVTTAVLGTAFNVEHYEHENDIRVTLVQGKVEVAAAKEKHILTPGQLMSYNTGSRAMEVRETDISSTKEWLNGKLVFNDIPLGDVLRRVAATYKIDIVYPQPALLEGKRLTGTYTRKAPADLLRKILFVHGLHLEEKSGQFIIRP